jgi:hypothetical protein
MKMTAKAARDSDYITQTRQRVRALWEAYHELRASQDHWNALGYADADPSNALAQGEGENAGITAAMVSAVVFDTMDEVKLRIFDTGHKTNLAKLL